MNALKVMCITVIACYIYTLTPAATAQTDKNKVEKITCAPGSAGPISTLALLGRKEEISPDNFYSYWRDIHGTLAARITGFWSYRQFHIKDEITSLRRLPEGYNKPIETLDGFADVSFCSIEDMSGLATSATAELIKHDEQNIFSYSYLYGATPGKTNTQLNLLPFQPLNDNDTGFGLIALLAKPTSTSDRHFKRALTSLLDGLPQRCSDIQRLRVNFFHPYNTEGWPAPGVNHQPIQLLNASIEFLFSNKQLAMACLQASPQSNMAGAGGIQLAYRINKSYAMVVDGKPSLIGLRGLPAIELISQIGAENQLSINVLDILYGQTTR